MENPIKIKFDEKQLWQVLVDPNNHQLDPIKGNFREVVFDYKEMSVLIHM